MQPRSFRRVHIDAEITIKAKDYSFTSKLDNISMGGLFVTPSKQMPVAVGDIFELSVPLPVGSRNASIAVNGMAIRINENGIAFRFLETDPDTLRVLFSFIYRDTIQT